MDLVNRYLQAFFGPVPHGHSSRQFSRAQFHIVTPFSLRIKVKGRSRQQIAFRIRICQAEDMFGRLEAALREHRICSAKHLVSESESRTESARQVGTD